MPSHGTQLTEDDFVTSRSANVTGAHVAVRTDDVTARSSSLDARGAA